MFYTNLLNSKMLNLIEAETAGAGYLIIYGGAVPSNADAAASATVLVEIPIAADWLANATVARPSVVAKTAGSWSATATGGGAGTAVTHFRIVNNAKNLVVLQGTAGQGGGNELNLDSANIALNQVVTVTAFQINSAN